MAKIVITTLEKGDPKFARLDAELEAARAAIKERAYHLSMQSAEPSAALDHWIQAEKQLYWVPNCELVENNGEFRLTAVLPGVEAKQVQLTATNDCLVISTNQKPANGERTGIVHLSEFSSAVLLRRIELPKPITPESVTAKLERGILEVVAGRQTEKATTAVKTTSRARPPRTKKSPPAHRTMTN